MNMKKKILTAIMGASAVGFAGYGINAMATTGSGTANVNIVQAITITPGTALNFGNLSPGASGGTAVVTTAGAISTTSTVGTQGGTVAAGTFTLGGAASTNYLVSFTAGTVTGPGPAMAVNTFTYSSANSGASCSPCAFSAGSADTLTVGATLTVGTQAAQTAGSYSGTYGITVVYQ